jgi:nucleoside triphosphate pyrophosphatase
VIYLASRSPRRRELLAQIGVRFEPLMFREGGRAEAELDESARAGETPDEYVRRMARMKCDAAWNRVKQRRGLRQLPVLAADTTVAVDEQILGKPADKEEAMQMLRLLSGRSHRVLTAVAVAFEERFQMSVNESTVVFEALDEKRMAEYVASGEPFDKAGGYGIQGRAGAFVVRIEGSYSGVMGLPLRETAQLLRKFGIVVP